MGSGSADFFGDSSASRMVREPVYFVVGPVSQTGCRLGDWNGWRSRGVRWHLYRRVCRLYSSNHQELRTAISDRGYRLLNCIRYYSIDLTRPAPGAAGRGGGWGAVISDW